MKYYVLKILTNKETKETKKSVYEYDDEKSARASVYSSYGSALTDTTVCQILCMLLDAYGSPLATLTWTDPESKTEQTV